MPVPKGYSRLDDEEMLDKIAAIDMEIRELERHKELTDNLRYQQEKRIQELERKRQALIKEKAERNKGK